MSAREWPVGHTYVAHALALSALHGPGPWPDGGEPAPDANQHPVPDAVLDGVLTHHGVPGGSAVERIWDLMNRPPDEVDLAALHDAAAGVRPLAVADALAEACAHDDPDEFRPAVWPATLLGIPYRDRLVRHLPRAPYEYILWWALVHGPGRQEGPDEFVELAMDLLPLDELASGPDLAFVERTAPAVALAVVVRQLDRHPGAGWPLIRTALSNESVHMRHLALFALEVWPHLPEDITTAVRDAIRGEPHDAVRQHMHRIAGRPADGLVDSWQLRQT